MTYFPDGRPPQLDDSPVDLRAIVSLLRRQLRLIATVAVLAIALAIGYVVIARPVYTATALVLVDPGQKSLIFSDDTSQSASTENARVESEVEILRAPTIALAVVEKNQLVSDPEFGPQLGLGDKIRQALGFRAGRSESGQKLVQRVLTKFQNATTIRRRGLTYIIAVSVDSESPDRAAKLANALTAAYIEAQIDSKIASRLSARDKLQEQITSVQQALTESETAIDSYIERNLDRLQSAGGSAALADLRRQLQDIDSQRLATEVRTREVRAAYDRRDWADVTARLGGDALAAFQAQRDQLERRLGGAAAGSSEEVNLRSALAALDAQQSQAVDTALDQLDVKAGSLRESLFDTREKLRQTLMSSDLPPEVLTEIYQLQQEATIARGQYQALLSRLREVETQAAVQMADSRVVSPALPPASMSFPRKKLILSLALAAGLGLGTIIAFLNEFYLGGIVSESQLREVLRLRVATAIPLVALKPDTEKSIADNVIAAPLSGYSEAIRRLRASIELELRKHPPALSEAGRKLGRTIAVTSTNPAEGKSTTALALARAFSLSQVSVLLIDADLRKPTLHHLTGLSPEMGLIDYLTDPAATGPTEALLSQDPVSSVTMITGRGRAFQETDQLLGSETFRTLVQAAREAFDIVILDTPPVGPVVDARYLVPFGDVVVMVVRFASTSQTELRQAVQVISEQIGPGKPLLTVLNHEPDSRRRFRDYKDYYSG